MAIPHKSTSYLEAAWSKKLDELFDETKKETNAKGILLINRNSATDARMSRNLWNNIFVGFVVRYSKPTDEVMMTPPQQDDFVDFLKVAVIRNQMKDARLVKVYISWIIVDYINCVSIVTVS